MHRREAWAYIPAAKVILDMSRLDCRIKDSYTQKTVAGIAFSSIGQGSKAPCHWCPRKHVAMSPEEGDWWWQSNVRWVGSTAVAMCHVCIASHLDCQYSLCRTQPIMIGLMTCAMCGLLYSKIFYSKGERGAKSFQPIRTVAIILLLTIRSLSAKNEQGTGSRGDQNGLTWCHGPVSIMCIVMYENSG